MKKLLLLLIVAVVLTGCGKQTKEPAKTVQPEEKMTEVPVNNGVVETIETNGFTVDITSDSDSATVTVNNVSAEEGTAYKLDLVVHVSDQNDITSQISLNSNLKEPYVIDLGVPQNSITGVEYDIEKAKIIMKGNPE